MPGIEQAIAIALGIALTPFISFLVLWSRRARGRRDVATGETVLEYGRSLKIFAVFGTAFFASLCLISTGALDPSGRSSDRERWLALGLLGPWFLIFASLAVEIFLASAKVGSGGIKKHSPWKGDLYLAWEEIESIRFDGFSSWYVMRCLRGKVRISSYLSGMEDFVEIAVEKIPEQKWSTPRPKLPSMLGHEDD